MSSYLAFYRIKEMTLHLCQSSEKLTWNKIKQSILGRIRFIDKFTCAGCSRSFETICCLHLHCMKHNEGGSYFFDHVTNTAFPKFDTRCSETQFEPGDTNEDGNHAFRTLIGRARSLSPIESDNFSYTKGNNSETEQIEVTVENIYYENDSLESDSHDQSVKQQVENTVEKVLPKEAKEDEVEECITGNSGGFVRVKVRGIERREDGSILFEMNETDAQLFQVTANILIEQLKKTGELPTSDQELEVMVPYDSLQFEQAGINDVSSCPTVKSNEAAPGEDQKVNSDSQAGINVEVDKDNDAIDDNQENTEPSVNHDKSKEMGISDESEGMVNDNGSVNIVKEATKKTEGSETIEQDVEHESSEKGLEKRDVQMSEEKNDVDKKRGDSSVSEHPIHTRSQRKRKLTAKMKESELPDILKVTKRRPRTHEIEHKKSAPKRTKTQDLSSDMDFNAGETLLSLRGTGSLKSVRCSRSKADLSRDKSTGGNEENDHDVSNAGCNEGANAEELSGSIIEKIVMEDIIDLKEGVQKDQSDVVQELKEDSEEIEDNKDGIIEDEKSVFGKKKNQEFPKKQRQKHLKSGQVPMRKRNDLTCNVCGKVGSLSMMKYHEQMHSDKMPYKCDECGKCFKTAACKRSHALQHGEKRWKCGLCPAAFFRKQYLEVHMTNHTGEYPYVCEICGMKFKMAYIVRRHVNNVHKNIRNYKCDICDKEFFRSSTRDQHRNRHFDPHLQCSYCPKKFKGDLDLRKHELTHTGEKMYFCAVCNQGFTQIWPYYKHMWKIHNIEKEEAKKMKIRNPDIVNMRNINKDSVKKEPAYVHEFIGKPGCTFDMRKSFSQNVNQLKLIENKEMDQGESESFEYTKGIVETNVETEGNIVYTAAAGSELSDTIVMNIGEDLDDQETIVIQTEELQTVNGQQADYIVVQNAQPGGNIVIYSDLAHCETEDVHEFIS